MAVPVSLFIVLTAFAAPVDLTTKSRSFIESLVDLSSHSRGSSGALSDVAKQKIKSVSAQINFQALAQASLGAKWGSFVAKDRVEFLSVLQELLEIVAYPKAKGISAQLADMEFKKINKSQVGVSGRLNREKRGEIISEKFNIVLIYSNDGAKIVDAVIEGEKLIVNLKRQFTEALKKKNFSEIIAQMKKRVGNAKAKNEPAA